MSARNSQRIGLSIRAFALRDGCDEKLVRRHIRRGGLETFPDGTLDPGLIGTGWREENRRRQRGADTADSPHARRGGRAEVSALLETGKFVAGVASGAVDLAQGMPTLIAEAALRAGLTVEEARTLVLIARPALTRRMAEIFDGWDIAPTVHLADDEQEAVERASTWASWSWADELHEVDWAALQRRLAGGET